MSRNLEVPSWSRSFFRRPLISSIIEETSNGVEKVEAKLYLFIYFLNIFQIGLVKSHEDFNKVYVTLCAICSARRKAIHEGGFQSPQATHEFIKRFMADLEIIKENQPGAGRGPLQQPATESTRPKAPPAGYAKIHVDDRVTNSNRRGSAAATARD